MYVYTITNKIDQKMYVGITVQNPPILRYRRHWREASKADTKLYTAMNKYGKDAFSFDIIDTASDIATLKALECYHIKKLNTLEEGYNLTSGGDGCVGYKHTPEHREYMRNIMVGKNKGKQPRLGAILSEETKRKIGNKRREMVANGTAKTLKGIPKSSETRAKISKAALGIARPQIEKTYQVTHPDGRIEIVTGLNRFCKDRNMNVSGMCNVMSGKSPHYKGYKCVKIERNNT